MGGMDEIWRERNAEQHQPKERLEINEKIEAAFEQRATLGTHQNRTVQRPPET